MANENEKDKKEKENAILKGFQDTNRMLSSVVSKIASIDLTVKNISEKKQSA